MDSPYTGLHCKWLQHRLEQRIPAGSACGGVVNINMLYGHSIDTS